MIKENTVFFYFLMLLFFQDAKPVKDRALSKPVSYFNPYIYIYILIDLFKI